MLNLTVCDKKTSVLTQTDTKSYNQFASTIIPNRPAKPLIFFHWMSNANSSSKIKTRRRNSSIGNKEGYKWWPDSQINSTILEIYVAKIRANRSDRNIGYPLDCMSDFVLDFSPTLEKKVERA